MGPIGGEGAVDRVEDAVGVRQDGASRVSPADTGRRSRRPAGHRRVELVEAPLGDAGGDLGAEAEEHRRLVRDDQASGLAAPTPRWCRSRSGEMERRSITSIECPRPRRLARPAGQSARADRRRRRWRPCPAATTRARCSGSSVSASRSNSALVPVPALGFEEHHRIVRRDGLLDHRVARPAGCCGVTTRRPAVCSEIAPPATPNGARSRRCRRRTGSRMVIGIFTSALRAVVQSWRPATRSGRTRGRRSRRTGSRRPGGSRASPGRTRCR